MAISHWPMNERPREKLILRGASALSDAELLAIFLRTGLPGITAIDLARDLIKEFGGLGALISSDHTTFCKAKGVGRAKFVQLKASVELTRRYLQEQLEGQPVFTSPEKVGDYLSVQMRDYKREVFVMLLLDSKHQLIDTHELFQGTVDAASVHPREVVARALRKNAAAVIVAHNHPSGLAEPSQADIDITRRLKQALNLVEIRLLDHLIIGRGEVVSLAQRGKL
ncbi:MAG: DNA repair protein RadC [Porticoccaceae bacterium]|nr:DNA repair protein RadC [Porticoccaceae bacterium]